MYRNTKQWTFLYFIILFFFFTLLFKEKQRMKEIQQVFGMKSADLILGGCGLPSLEFEQRHVCHICVYVTIMLDWRDLCIVSLFTIT